MLAVAKVYNDIWIGCAKPLRKLLGTIYRTMLPSSASEAHTEVSKPPLYVLVDALGNKSFSMFNKLGHSLLSLEEFNDRAVLASVCTVLLVTPWVGQRTAVE